MTDRESSSLRQGFKCLDQNDQESIKPECLTGRSWDTGCHSWPISCCRWPREDRSWCCMEILRENLMSCLQVEEIKIQIKTTNQMKITRQRLNARRGSYKYPNDLEPNDI